MANLLNLFICLMMIAASAFLSAAEVALFSLSPNELSQLNEDNKTDKELLELRSNPERLLATLLIAVDFINIGLIMLLTYTINSIFDFSNAQILGFLVETIFITFILLLFAEVLPKIYATQHTKALAIKATPALRFCQRLFAPLIKILVNSTSYLSKKLAAKNYSNISVDELSEALKLTSDKNEDNEILEGIVKFGNINVSKIMTSRTQMVDIEIKNNFRQVLQIVTESGYSRIPVYSGNEDNVRGILYVKDLLAHLEKGDNFKWQSLIRPAYFVPETKMIDDLLSDFQKNKIHIAMVVDEFGGISGLLTLEDILEEIVGEINDEYDEKDILYSKIDANTFLLEAKILLTDFFRIEGIEVTDFESIAEEADTLAGLILAIKGEIPVEKEKISFGNYTFEIVKADNRHIEKVKLYIKRP